jgi:hypothetical protein
MFNQARTWRVIVPIVLIVLVMAMTLGMVCHHHDHCASAQCTVCHLVIAPPTVNADVSGMVLASAESVIHYNRLIPRPVARHIPARAPPA